MHVRSMNIQLSQGFRGGKPADLPSEILAGVTLAALMIPLNIGYVQVAGLSATAGLYAAILPMVAYAIFCAFRQVMIAGWLIGHPRLPQQSTFRIFQL
jgi:MFS superfamily sulfate permease-like transporter